MSDEVDEILGAVAADIEPGPDERAALEEAVETLMRRAEAIIDELGIDASVIHVGSTARDTWMSGERDIDIFVTFPPSSERETLGTEGLSIGRAIIEDGRANYAEHPYITGTFDGFDVDVVPCFAVDAATEARSSVDRTPFHNAYISERIDESLAGEIRLAKRFMHANDAYGSNLKTRGFGGYLLELLVLEYGSCRGLLEAAADWPRPVTIDPADHASTSFDDDLVVIDPTDPNRNVAAVVTSTNLARVQHYARRFLTDPDRSIFEPTTRDALTSRELTDHLKRRGTAIAAIRFDRPEMVDDQLYPQLRKTAAGIADAIDRRGFGHLRSASFASKEHLVILLEAEVGVLSTIERHLGPPVHLRDHAERFFDAYDDTDVTGPYIEDGRYIIERPRDHTTLQSFLESEAIFDVRIGDQLRPILADDYAVYVGEDLDELLPEFAEALREYFDPDP